MTDSFLVGGLSGGRRGVPRHGLIGRLCGARVGGRINHGRRTAVADEPFLPRGLSMLLGICGLRTTEAHRNIDGVGVTSAEHGLHGVHASRKALLVLLRELIEVATADASNEEGDGDCKPGNHGLVTVRLVGAAVDQDPGRCFRGVVDASTYGRSPECAEATKSVWTCWTGIEPAIGRSRRVAVRPSVAHRRRWAHATVGRSAEATIAALTGEEWIPASSGRVRGATAIVTRPQEQHHRHHEVFHASSVEGGCQPPQRNGCSVSQVCGVAR